MLKRVNLSILLFFLSLAFSLTSNYIPFLGISISLRSIPIAFAGYLMNPFLGFMFGSFVDLISFSFSNYPYFVMYTIQAGLIGFAGGFLKYLKNFEAPFLKRFFFLFQISLFSIFGVFAYLFHSAYFFPLLSLCLAYLVVLNFFFWFFYTEDRFYICTYILLSFISLLLSFVLGLQSTLVFAQESDPLIFLFSRVIKEIFKISFIAPMIYSLLFRLDEYAWS